MTPNGWEKVLEGTTIGYKRLLRFDDIVTDRTRIRITGARGVPEIASAGLYYGQIHR